MSKEQIVELARDVEIKSQLYEAHCLRNVYGLTSEERIAASVEFHLAEVEMHAARKRLDRAKEQLLTEITK